MEKCIFCKIANHEAPANIIYEDDVVMAFLDNDPISDGHTLIIPKKDIKDINSIDSETSKRIMEVAKFISGKIENRFKFDGTMIMEVNGAFQDVPHFHLHVFGRNKNNDIKFNYPENVNSNKDHLERNASKLTD